MKTLTTKITILLLVLVSTSSCIFDNFGIRGNGNIVSEDRKISSDFNAIKVSQGIIVHLTQGNEVDLSVEADENIIDLLVTEVNGDVLKIFFEKNVNKVTRNVYLTVDKLNEIRTSSGSQVKSEGVFKSKSLNLDSSSGSSIQVDIETNTISASASSGSSINIKGNTSSFKGDASSGSHINAYDLESEIGDADVSSGAGIKISVSEQLTAHASSGGNVNYRGNPQVNQSKSSGGSISKH